MRFLATDCDLHVVVEDYVVKPNGRALVLFYIFRRFEDAERLRDGRLMYSCRWYGDMQELIKEVIDGVRVLMKEDGRKAYVDAKKYWMIRNDGLYCSVVGSDDFDHDWNSE